MAKKNKVELAFASEQHKKGTLKAFEQIRKLLSDKNAWMKGDLFGTNEETGQDTFCLLGAAEHVDGPQETLVKAIMVAQLDPTNIEYSAEDGLEIEESVVAEYNDANIRKHSQIVSFLDRCIKEVKALKIKKPEKVIILGE